MPDQLAPHTVQIGAYLKLIRIRESQKNLFVFIPLLLEGKISEWQNLYQTAIIFILFSFASFAVYVFNDICDLKDDRKHALKRFRPLAARIVPIGHAWLLIGLFLGLIVTVAAFEAVSLPVAGIIAAYLITNVCYSLGLKRILVIDLLVVVSGYILRILSGNIAISIAPNILVLLVIFPGCLLLVTGKRKFDIGPIGKTRYGPRMAQLYSDKNLAFALNMIALTTIAAMGILCVDSEMVDRFGKTTMFIFWGLVTFAVIRYLMLAARNEKIGDPAGLVLRDRPITIACLSMLSVAVVKIYF